MPNLNISEPHLGQRQPIYPPLTQLVRVTSGTVAGPGFGSSSISGPTLYVSFTQQLRTDTLVPRDREPCLVNDVNNVGLSPGYHLGRLAGSWTGLPVYEVAALPGSATLAGDVIGASGNNVAWGLTKVPICSTLPSPGSALVATYLDFPNNFVAGLVAGGSLTVGQDYYYAVSSLDATGESNAAGPYSAGVLLGLKVTPTVGNRSVQLMWSQVAPDNWVTYNVYRTTTPGVWTSPRLLTTVANGTSATISFIDDGSLSLQAGHPYQVGARTIPPDADYALEWCPQSVQTIINNTTTLIFNNYTITVNNTTLNFNNTVFSISNSVVDITDLAIINFGISTSVNISPPGIFSKPTQIVTGAPRWVPPYSYFPLLWGAYDHIEWEWDGFVEGAGSSATPGGSGWIPFVSVGRTPVNDGDYTCTTRDRVVAFVNITMTRTVTLPRANSLPPGFTLTIQDESGKTSDTEFIAVIPQLPDTINVNPLDTEIINIPFGGATAETDGTSNWTIRQYPGASGGGTTLTGVHVYTSGVNTWTKPAGLSYIEVELAGSGGGGGGASSIGGTTTSGAGGGGGGASWCKISAASLGATETATVGTGGAGGLGSGSGAGTAGADSTFTVSGGSTITGKGGNGGGMAQATLGNAVFLGATGGTVTNANTSPVNVPGGPGGTALIISVGVSGAGGVSGLGLGTGVVGVSGNSNGNAGTGYGSGGSGGNNNVTGTNYNGGAGANGVIIIKEYS